MKCKSKLKDTEDLSDVFIEHDKDRNKRLQEANWRCVIKAVNNKDTSLVMKGNRVLFKEQNPREHRGGTNNRGCGRGGASSRGPTNALRENPSQR